MQSNEILGMIEKATKNIDPSWNDCFLEAREELIHIFKIIKKHINQEINVYPDISDIFNSFVHTKLDQVKVVIFNKSAQSGKIKIGDNLLCRELGIPFCAHKGEKIPIATLNIFKEIKRCFPDFIEPIYADLRGLLHQGVFIVNLALTITDMESFNHNQIWDGFILYVIKHINAKNINAIYLLWGNNIDRVKNLIGDKNPKLECGHPSYLNTSDSFLGSNHFLKVNEILYKYEIKEIDWTRVTLESVNDFNFEFYDPEAKIKKKNEEIIKKEQKKHLPPIMKEKLKKAFETNQLESIIKSKINLDCIKNWAKEYNIKPKSGLNKSQTVHFIYEEYMKCNKKIKSELDSFFPIFNFENQKNFSEDLINNGFCVFDLKGWDDEIKHEFFDWLSKCDENFDISDRKTWKIKGHLNHYIAQTEFLWKLRELMYPVYQKILKEDALLTSMEGCYFNFEENVEKMEKVRGSQNLFISQKYNYVACIRSFVNFTDNNNFVFVENSNKLIDEYVSLLEKDPLYKPKIGDTIFKDCKLLRVSCKAGQVLMWDARMFYFILKDESINLGAFISMFPYHNLTKNEKLKRKKCYENGQATNHWCYGENLKIFPEHKGLKIEYKPKVIEKAILNEKRVIMLG